jgi:hypothetical protein
MAGPAAMYLAVQELAQRTTMVRALASVATSRSPARISSWPGRRKIPTATRAGWVIQASGSAGTGRGILHSVIESYWASRSRRPRDPVMGVIR